MMKEQFFQTPHLRLHYAQGPRNGEPLLLLHGSGSLWQTFSSILPELTSKFQVYALDLRGHGRSERVPGHYHFENHAMDIHFFIQHCIQKPPVVFGHSLGGMIGMHLASQYPESVARLIIADSPLSLEQLKGIAEEQNTLTLEIIDALSHYQDEEHLREILKKVYPNPKEKDPAFEFLVQSFWLTDPQFFQTFTSECFARYYSLYKPQKYLSAIQCPTLILRGAVELGAFIDEKDAKWALQLLSNGEEVFIEKAGHGLHHQDKEAVLQAIMTFLK